MRTNVLNDLSNVVKKGAGLACSWSQVGRMSEGAPDEHPMSIRSASDGERWKPAGEKGSTRVWKHVAMIFAVLTLSIANIGMAWGASPLTIAAPSQNVTTQDGVTVAATASTGKIRNKSSQKVFVTNSASSIWIYSQLTNITSISFDVCYNSGTTGSSNAFDIFVATGGAFAIPSSGFTATKNETSLASLSNINVVGTNATTATSISVTFTSPVKAIILSKNSYDILVENLSISYDAGTLPTTYFAAHISGTNAATIDTNPGGASTSVATNGSAVTINSQSWLKLNSGGISIDLGSNKFQVGDQIVLDIAGASTNKAVGAKIQTGSGTDKVAFTQGKITNAFPVKLVYVVTSGDGIAGTSTAKMVSTSTDDRYYSWSVLRAAADCEAVAAPTGLTCSAQTQTSLTYTWSKASHASTYTAKLYSDSGCESEVKSSDLGDVATVTFSDLTAGTTYYCKVQSHGDGSTYCAEGGTTSAASGTTDACTAISPTWSYPFSTVAVGITIYPTIGGNTGGGAVTYSSSATSKITNDCYATAAGSATLTANVAANGAYCSGSVTSGTITVVADQSGLIKQTLTTGESAWGTPSAPATTDGTNITSTTVLSATDLTISGNGNTSNGGQTAKITGMTAGSEGDNSGKYMRMGFTVKSGKQLNVSAIYIPVQPVSSDANNFKAVLSDGETTITGTLTNSKNGKLAYIKFDSYGTVKGNVTLTLYAWGWTGGYRLGKSIVIDGEIEDAPSSCTAPSSVSVDATNTNGWRYSIGETIDLTCTASGGSGGSYTYQWQKYIGSSWEDIDGATNARFQKANCTSSDGGQYRCVVSTGATCSLASDGFNVRVWTLNGNYSGSGFTENAITWTGANTGTATVTLNANSTYEFKVYGNGDGKYYGCNSGISSDISDWTFRTNEGNCALTTGALGGGEYTFAINISNAGENNITVAVTYPRKTIYVLPNGYTTASAKLSIYYWRGGTNGWSSFLSSDECGAYSTNIPGWAETFSIVRLNSDATAGSWDKKWNQTVDITANASYNQYEVNTWCSGDGCKESVTAGTYSIPTYTISYNAGTGGSGTKADESKTCGVAFTLPNSAVFTRTGYTQTGWTTSDGGAQEYALGGTYTTNEDKTFYPVWTVNNYDLTWNLAGGTTTSAGTGIASGVSVNTTTSQAYGTALTAPTVTKTGYNFSAWSPTVAGTMPAANTTYTATWTAKTTAITLEAGEGGTDGSATATYGTSTITDYVAATRTGYTLGNYYKDDGDHNILTKEGTLNTGNKGSLIVDSKWASEDAAVTLYAQWSATSYTLSYDLAGGSVASPNPTSYTIESSAITLNNPTKTGYTFAGWTGTGLAEATTTVTIAAGSTGNRSYTATWTAIVPTSVSLNKSSTTITEGGTETLTATISPAVVADNTITWSTSDADVATVDGGVVTAVAAGTATITATTVNGKTATCAVTVEAAVTYTVTYNYNGADGGSRPASATGASVTLPEPTKTGYTLDGWYTTAGAKVDDGGETYSPTADITLYARWTETCSGGGGGDPIVIKLFDGSTDDDFAASPITVSGVSLAYTAYDKPAEASNVSSKTNNVNSKNYANGYQFSTSEINKGANRKCLSFTVPSGYTATFTHAFGASGNSRVIRLGSSLVTTDEDENYIATLVTVPSSGGSGGIWGGTYSSSLSAGTYFITGTGGGWQIVELIFTLTPTGSPSACNKVLYHGNGAESGYIYDPIVYDDGDDPVVLGNTTGANGVAFVKDDYEFQGWATSAGGSVAYTAGNTISDIGDDVDLYAVWAEVVPCTSVDAPTVLTCSAHTSSSLTFTWTKAANASTYTAKLYSDAECTSQVASQDLGDVATVTFSTLSAETTYYCKVQSHGDGSTYCADGGTTAAQSGTTDAACTAHGLAYGTAAVAKNDGDAPFTNTLTNPHSLVVTYSSSNTSAATVNATSGMVTIEGAGVTTITATWAGDATYCSGTATYTLTVSSGCTPQSLVKTQLTSVNAGTTTGYNDGQYAGDPVIATFQKTPIDGGYKMTGSAKLFVTIKGGFVADDKINIVITQASDLTYTTGKLLIFYNASSPALLTTIDAASAGTYTYTLKASDITTLGSNKTIGVFRSSGETESNPYVKSVEVEGCREWAVCTAPDAVAAGSVTGEGATFTITDALNTNNYEIYYSTSSTAPTADTSPIVSGISTKSRAVTGLTAETTYYYWVRSNCGGATKSSWVAGTPTTFTTSAAAATNSVTYNGNGASSGSVPTDDTAYEGGDVVTVLGNTGSLVKTGQTFLGWSTNATPSSGTFYPAGYKFYMPNEAVTLYAVWGSASEEKYYYGSITITAGALTPGSTGGHKGFFTNDGGVIATSSAISLSSTPGETGYYYESSTLTHTALNKSSNWNTSSTAKRTIRAFKFKSGDSYTLALGSKTATSIMFYGRCGSASKTMTVGSVDYESPSTKDQFFSHEYTKVGNFTGNVTITQDGDFYGILVVTVSTGAGSNHTVTFNMNGKGSAIADIENVPSGSKIGAPVPSPTAVGAEFGGWYREAGCTNAWNFGSSTISKDTTLYAKWTTCAPSISAHPVAATYTQGAAATALSVTASGEGLNYQWYTSEDGSADIQGSSAIPGATSASYTPSTSLLGTIYYFCVVSNTCGNAVSNKAAITVNDGRPTPTANWTIEEPEEGGKGFTFSIEVNKGDGTNWDGELIASMLTLSDNAILDGASIEVNNTNKTISGTYGVKAGSSSPVTFYLLLPATTSQSATRLDHDRTFSPCAGGAGDNYIVRVRKDYEKDASNNYRWVTAGAGEITYAVSSSISSAKAASTVASVFDSIMPNDKQYVWVKTYESNTKTIRLYVETSGANVSVNTLYKNTVYATAADKDIVSSDDYSVSYDGSGTAENTGAKGTHYMDITFDSPLAANDIICVKFSSSKVRAYGAILTTVGDGGDQTTGLSWSNSQASGATVVKREDDADFAITAVRDATALKSLGLISYTSSNTAIATVNASTGQVHIADNIDFGSDDYKTTTITATLAASGCYKKAVITYILRVNKYVCEDTPGTITYVDRGCSGMDLTLEGYEEGATIKWYKDGVEIPSATSATYNATVAGEYYAVTHKTCDITSTNSITLEAATATAEKIVDSWYVKNGRRTPDIALVQTTGATNFTVTSGGTITEIGGCTFELKDDGIIYLHGQKEDGSAPSDMTAGDMTITITVSGCTGELSGLDITIHKQAETAKPSVAFVVDGTLRKDGGTATSVSEAKTSDRDLWKYLENSFTLTGCNVYWSVDSKELREYYSQYDAILITDDPSTYTKGAGGVEYVKAFGTMVDVRPILTMEAYVGRYSDGGWHVYKADPTSPNPRQVEMKLECKNHDIFAGLDPETSDNVRVTRDEYNNEYWHVIMVDTTVAPYHNTSKDYKDLPALQGFDPHKFDHMLGVGTIAEETLQGGVERQEEPAARMMILGIQNEAMAALTNEGKLIIKNAIEYLLKTNMEDVNDCSNYFTGGPSGTGDNWATAENWSSGKVPDFESRVRILRPVVISGDTKAIVARVDIATSGKSKWVDGECNGKVTVNPRGALIVGGKIRRAEAPHFGIDDLEPTENDDLIVKAEANPELPHKQGALIFDNSDGDTHAVVEMWNPSHWEMDGSKKKKYWSYVAVPIQEADIPNFFWYGFTYLYDETSGWIKKSDGTSLYPFQGIGASLQEGNMETFYGPLATTESQDITLTYTGGARQGMNLIGNSWTAPIQIANFEEDDFGDAAAEVWVFNTGNKNEGQGDGTTTTAGQWNAIPINMAGAPGYEGLKVIPAMQAFEVNTTSETTLHLDYDRLVRAGRENLNEPMRAPRRGSAAKQIEATMRVRVSGELTHTDVYLLKDARFSDGFDNGWDGHFLSGDDRSAQLYAISEAEGELAFLAQPEIEGTQLGFAPSKKDTEYTFSFSYDGEEPLYLNDLKLKESTLIDAENTYLFTYEEGDAVNRFYISATPFEKPNIATGTETIGHPEKVQKVMYKDHIYIIRGGKVFDVVGKMVK